MNNKLNDLVKLTDRCINCGFCEAVCPTLEAFSYDSAEGARGRIIIAKDIQNRFKDGDKLIKSFYSCLDCNACLYVCPAGISAGNASDIVKKMIVEESKTGNNIKRDPVSDMIVRMIMKYNSPLGISKKGNAWVEKLEFDKTSDILFYTGQMYMMASYSKKFATIEKKMGKKISNLGAIIIKKIPFLLKILPTFLSNNDEEIYKQSVLNIYTLLREAGLKLNYLNDEPYPGTFLIDLGYEEEFKIYAERIYNEIKREGIKTVVTVDPHTYTLLKYIYPKYITDFDLNIVFYVDIINDLKFKNINKKVILHEPCHLVRGQENYFGVTLLLDKVSDLELPDNNGVNTYCCGGPDELLYPQTAEKVSEKRYQELRKKGNFDIITACPICLSNLRKDGNVRDLSYILIDALEKK